MAAIDDVEIPSLLFAEGSAPSTPASGFGRLYVKTTGLFFKGDNGVEVGPLAAASSGTYFTRVRQTLTDKTSFAGTSAEQWGTEEATLDDAVLPGTTNVTVFAMATGRLKNPTSDTELFLKVEISLDGGATWSASPNTAWLDDTNSTSSFIPFTQAHQVTGSVTGDIQARVMATCGSGAGAAFDLEQGVVFLEVSRPA